VAEISSNPRVLVVTPEVTYLPDRMGGLASFFTAKAGGLADVSAALVTALPGDFQQRSGAGFKKRVQ
jgi:starch synthase/alpha-amylase